MNNFIDVTTITGDCVTLNVNFISELKQDSFERVILIMSNGNKYMVTDSYANMKCQLYDIHRPMTM